MNRKWTLKVKIRILYILVVIMASYAVVAGTRNMKSVRDASLAAIQNVADKNQEEMKEESEEEKQRRQQHEENLKEQKKRVEECLKHNQDQFFFITLIFLILCISWMLYFSKDLMRGIDHLSEYVKRMAGGDFQQPMDERYMQRQDDLGVLAGNLNQVYQNMNELISQVQKEAKKLDQIIYQTQEDMKQLTQDIQAVANMTEELSRDHSETAVSARQVNGMSDEINHVAKEITDHAQDGLEKVNSIFERATGTKESMDEKSTEMIRLQDKINHQLATALENVKVVEQIEVLANAIMNVTSQTNLLALNASIESARAGEAGKGFAVVADEIRNLAEQSASNVENIQNVTKKVQEAVGELINSAEELHSYVNNQVAESFGLFSDMTDHYNQDAIYVEGLVNNLGSISEELMASLDSVADSISNVTMSSVRGADNTNEMSGHIQDIAEKTEEIHEKMQQVQRASKNLHSDVQKFKV